MNKKQVIKQLTKEPGSYQWAIPENIEVPQDALRARLDFYHDCIILYTVNEQLITTHMVSGRDIITALLSEVPLNSGLLPNGALWWAQGKEGVEVGLWYPAKVWPIAIQLEPRKPPRRFKLPMPGLIFVCSPAKAPRVYAAKSRPKTTEDIIYHAPLFNLFSDGRSCPGTNKYPSNVLEIPESFMVSYFTATDMHWNRSQQYPKELLKRWETLDGKKKYPLNDLMKLGTLQQVMEGGLNRW